MGGGFVQTLNTLYVLPLPLPDLASSLYSFLLYSYNSNSQNSYHLVSVDNSSGRRYSSSHACVVSHQVSPRSSPGFYLMT